MKKIALAAALVALSSGSAFAATANGTATANVVAPITVTHVPGASLNFGSFTSGAAGTVVVTPADVGTATGGVTHVALSTTTADDFTVAGDGTRAYSVSTAAGTVSDGTNSMAFITTPSSTTGVLVLGAGSFSVGGTLTVGANQVPNVYTGSYVATVNYQ